MIQYLHIKNFKALHNIHLKPTNLNLCFGMNGMGKSTLLQALLLLRQSHQKGVLENKGLLLQGGDLISIGTGKDAFYQFAGKEDLLQFEISTTAHHKYKWAFQFDAASDILPRALNLEGGAHQNAELDSFALFNQNFSYLSADRLSPQKVYSKSEYEITRNRNIGARGEYAVHYLSQFGLSEKVEYKNLRHQNAKSDYLLHQTIAWLSEISPGTRLVIEDIKGSDLLKLGFQFEIKSGYTNEFSPINVGFGVLYVLPVILALLMAKTDDIVLVENPESHLHPKGQSAIGQLLAATAANGVQIFCESHSDHIINGVRVAVKNEIIRENLLSIYYFSRNLQTEEHKTEITEILIDRHGELNNYPEGLLDEWNNLLVKLI